MLTIKSPAFENNQMIPEKYAWDGADINPPLEIDGVPENAESLVLVVDDPDAPNGNWNHWLAWNINPAVKKIDEDTAPEGAILGQNDFGRERYGGPHPPSGIHRYFFKVYALDTILAIPEWSNRETVLEAMEGHIIDQAELMGKYGRI